MSHIPLPWGLVEDDSKAGTLRQNKKKLAKQGRGEHELSPKLRGEEVSEPSLCFRLQLPLSLPSPSPPGPQQAPCAPKAAAARAASRATPHVPLLPHSPFLPLESSGPSEPPASHRFHRLSLSWPLKPQRREPRLKPFPPSRAPSARPQHLQGPQRLGPSKETPRPGQTWPSVAE